MYDFLVAKTVDAENVHSKWPDVNGESRNCRAPVRSPHALMQPGIVIGTTGVPPSRMRQRPDLRPLPISQADGYFQMIRPVFNG